MRWARATSCACLTAVACSATNGPRSRVRWSKSRSLGELAKVIDDALPEKIVCETFVHKRNGKAFTRDGLGAMFRRHCVGSPTHPVDPVIADFGLRDLRAKGATEMYRANRDAIHRVQLLLGHK